MAAAFVGCLARLFEGASLHGPHLLDLEVAQVLRRYERAGDLTKRSAGTVPGSRCWCHAASAHVDAN